MLCHSRRCVNPVARKTCACGINPLRKGTAGTRRSGDCSFFCGEYRFGGGYGRGPCAARGGRAAGDVRPRRDLSPSAASASQRAFGGSLCHGKWCSDCLCLDCPIGRSLCPRQMGRALSLDVRRSPSLRRFRVSPGRGSAEGQGTGPDVKARRPVARTGRMDYGLKR